MFLLHGPKSVSGISPEKYHFSHGVFWKRGQTVFSLEELFSRATLVKDSRTVSAGMSGEFFIKRYNTRTFLKKLKRSLQYPRSFRSLAAACDLERIGILTPEVIAASRYYLATSVLPENAVFLDKEPDRSIDFVPVLAQLHRHGFLHGDLSLRNIYYDGDLFGLIDLDSARSCRISEKMRLRELARLAASKAFVKKEDIREDELLQFHESYVRSSGVPLDPADFRKECLALREEYRNKYER